MEKQPTGPVYRPFTEEVRQVPAGTRLHFDLPAGPVLVANGAIFVGSGWFLYHTIKGIYKLNREVPR